MERMMRRGPGWVIGRLRGSAERSHKHQDGLTIAWRPGVHRTRGEHLGHIWHRDGYGYH
jgi:hypothetical protein